MKAVAVTPGKATSTHPANLQEPNFSAVSEERGVLLKVLRLGRDHADEEIKTGELRRSPGGLRFCGQRVRA